MRFGVVFWLIVAYALFAVGHVEIAASVDIMINFAGNVIDFSGFQAFSIARAPPALLLLQVARCLYSLLL